MTNPIDTFTKLLGINPAAGKFLGIGMLVLSAAAIVISWGLAPDALYRTALYVIGFSVLAFVLMNLSGLIVRVLGWALTVAAICWSGAMMGQIISGGRLPVAPVQCLIYPISDSCAVIQANNNGSMMTDDSQMLEVDPNQPIPQISSIDRVYIQFAGSIERKDVISFANSLVENDWPVKGADQGGERTGKAANLNEIRFFHSEDREAAEKLANQSSAISPAGMSIGVRDLSGTQFSNDATKGLLEIWLSN